MPELHSDTADSGPSRLLSLIIIGRNDSYMGNFKYRLATALNHLARNIQAIGRAGDVEIVVTDWNSNLPLSAVLPLSAEAAQVCRFLVVPPDVARTVQNPGETFHGACATNVALRRAQGEYLMLFDADSLMPAHSLRAVLALLDGQAGVPFDIRRTYFFSGRYQIPWEIVQREPSLPEWDRYLALNSGQLPPDSRSYGLGIFGIGLLMHRQLWHECRGYNESLHGWGWVDAELILRVTQRYPWADLASVGVSIFHMEHHSRKRRAGGGGHALNPYDVSASFSANDERWGLGDHVLPFQAVEALGAQAPAAPGLPEWPATRAQVLAELTHPDTLRHVRRSLTSAGVRPEDWGSLYALAWYAGFHYPRSYLEFGIRDPYAAAIVAGACPGVEMYGIDNWARDGGRPAPPPSFITSTLESINYRGYARFVSGDMATAFQRLKASSIGPLALDLIFVRGDCLAGNPADSLCDIAAALAPGGALVFTAQAQEAFDTAWSRLQQDRPDLACWTSRARRCGLAVAARLRDDPSQPPDRAGEERQLAAAWKPVAFSRNQLAIWRRRAQSIISQLRHQSVRRWPALLRSRWSQFRDRWRVS